MGLNDLTCCIGTCIDLALAHRRLGNYAVQPDVLFGTTVIRICCRLVSVVICALQGSDALLMTEKLMSNLSIWPPARPLRWRCTVLL